MLRDFPTSDRALAARLEAAEAAIGARMAQAAAATHDVAFEPFAGGVALFAGVGSPMTHAVGIGMRGTASHQELERLEMFYRDRRSACVIDLCTLADTSVIAFVQSRPYRVVEFNNIMVRQIAPEERFEVSPDVRAIGLHETADWARVVSEGFSEYMPVSEEMVDLLASTCAGGHCWLAGREVAAGGAAMSVHQSVALLVGDAVRLEARRQGWQGQLIRARLAAAQRLGCELAMASVLPGSISHRNYERAGFQLLYTRVNIVREF
ncbi:MAG: hypothetical protein JOY54_14945 [Acidobacteriaceae bacterium]|nr:hypothetical protein [Acidobacteriaceae bacterium]